MQKLCGRCCEMDFIKILREDADLSDLLCDVCDMEIFPECLICLKHSRNWRIVWE